MSTEQYWGLDVSEEDFSEIVSKYIGKDVHLDEVSFGDEGMLLGYMVDSHDTVLIVMGRYGSARCRTAHFSRVREVYEGYKEALKKVRQEDCQ
jgi:hypothetical protein